MDEGVGVTKIVQEFVAQASTLMGARHETGHIEQFNGHRSCSGDAGAVVGFAAGLEIVASTRAGELEVTNRSLWVYGGESFGICES